MDPYDPDSNPGGRTIFPPAFGRVSVRSGYSAGNLGLPTVEASAAGNFRLNIGGRGFPAADSLVTVSCCGGQY